MTISWYSVKEHNPEDFGNVFELIESKFVEYKIDICTNNREFIYSDLQNHFIENCLNKIDYVKTKFSKNKWRLETSMPKYYLKLYHNVIIIKNNIDISNYDFKLLCDIIKSDLSFQDDLNNTMTKFNNEQSLLEPTTSLIKEWGSGLEFKPWYKIETKGIIGWDKTKTENVYIKIPYIKTNMNFSYLFEFFKHKNLIYINTESPFATNNLKYLQDYISTSHIVQAYSRDLRTKYIIPLHNKIEIFRSQMGNEYSDFIDRIQQNKHCFEQNMITTKKFKNVETQTPLSLRHFK